MSTVIRFYLLAFARIYLHFFSGTRKERATRQKSQIAAASGSYASVHLQSPQIHRDETRLNGEFV